MPESKKYPLGLIVTPELLRTEEEDRSDRGIKGHIHLGTPAEFDLRNVGGKSYVTPIQNQGDCGSCVAFGSCNTFESTKMVADQQPQEPDVKRSEWDLFNAIGSCANGSTLEKANTRLQSVGVCAERCYPYNASGPSPCCAQTRMKIDSASRVTSDADAKEWISTKGALQVAMDVYSDFFDYTGGVYSHMNGYGDIAGGHCVSLVGYHDAANSTDEGYWIGKNSWGTDWGMSGFFKIAYNDTDSGILRTYAGYKYNISGVPPVAQTGVHINAGGLKADVINNSDGSHLGNTDQDISLVAGIYDVTCKLAGYNDYPLKFAVVDKQVTTINITLIPLPKVDITVPKDGSLYAFVSYVSALGKKAELFVNGVSFGVLAKKYVSIPLGHHTKGDGLQFDLKPEKGHSTVVHSLPFGYGWFVQMSVSGSGMDVMLLVQEK